MIAERLELADAQLESPLGRVSPVVKLAIALVWLLGLAFTLEPLPPLVLALVALGAGLTIGAIPPATLARALAPLWIAALGVGLSNALFSASNGDPTATTLVMVGPIRITVEAAATALSVVLRITAVAAVGVVFTLTTDSTRLADALVQQARVPARFAYGALAAYQSIPRFAEDLSTLRQARRIRGLRGSWHPRLLIGVLVLAIRHGDRMALSMDSRAFGSGPRTAYRVVRWGLPDVVVGVAAIAILVAMLAVAG
ncbi:MAG TPA: energy-coupling factor transporter transmembrane component T [Candidatus Limnocylindrales bacterium]